MRGFVRLLAVTLSLAASCSLASDVETEAAFTAAQKALCGKPEMTARFEMNRQVAGWNNPVRSCGTVSALERLGVVWKTTEPIEDIVAFGLMKRAATADDGSLSIEPMRGAEAIREQTEAFLAGDVARWKDYFFVEGRSEENGRWELLLTPKNETILTFMKECRVAGDDRVRSLQVYRPDGTIIAITFSDFADRVDAEAKALLEKLR